MADGLNLFLGGLEVTLQLATDLLHLCLLLLLLVKLVMALLQLTLQFVLQLVEAIGLVLLRLQTVREC